MLKIFNTASGKKEEFVSLKKDKVGMYTCGMTVYDYAHIGHGRKYVGDDIIRRTLEFFRYTVNHVQNVTDVGHLSSDEDEGEDKLEKGALKHGKTVWDVADFFTDNFYQSMDRLNIERPTIVCKATDHIPEQIALVETLIKKGFAYDTPEAVYFDIEQFPDYGKFFGQKLEDKKTGVRDEVHTGEYKKNPHDFVLWFKRVGRFANHTMHWESPFGDGFPGWHLECSAMSMKYLGETFDIHTGGIDHIPVHHPNEIAQSEAATGKPFVKYWIHHAFLTVDGKKMSKSLDNFYTIDDVIARGFDPMALRFFYLSAHYRQQLNFTWEALEGAQAGYKNLCGLVRYFSQKFGESAQPIPTTQLGFDLTTAFVTGYVDAITDDFNVPKVIAFLFDYLKRAKQEAELTSSDYDAICGTVMSVDKILGLGLGKLALEKIIIPQEIQTLIDTREEVRSAKNWAESDRLRDEIQNHGFTIEDTPDGPVVRPS